MRTAAIRLGLCTGLAAAVLAAGLPAAAQPRPTFLIINQEELLSGSARGKALLAQEDAARDSLRNEARALDSAFEAEERQLTDLRATLPPDEFRAKAEDFDKRVVAARAEQDDRSNALAQEFDGRRRQFYASVAPILVRMMERYGALAVFDESSVLLADQRMIVTDAVIAEIDAATAGAPPGGTPLPPPAATPPDAGTLPDQPTAPAAVGGSLGRIGPMPRPQD